MGLFNFLKLPKQRNFDYQPRFWDREKEERKEKLKRYNNEKDNDPNAMKERISSSFQKRGTGVHASVRQKQVRNSNIRLILIIVVLCIVSYVLINVYLPSMLKALGM